MIVINMISNSDLIALNKRGFVAGPDEDEETFLNRISFLKKLKEDPQSIFSSHTPFPFEETVKLHHWDLKRCDVKHIFDISADWISAFYHNQHLPFWQGAATWVIHEPSLNVKLALLQLRKSLKKGSHLMIYQLDEVMAHETVHAVRMAFQEPIFEEHFAYLTSSSTFRKVFGPISKRPWEMTVLFGFLIGIFFAMFDRLLWENNWSYFLLPFSYFCCLSWISLGLIRLAYLRTIFTRAHRKISKMVFDKPLAVLLRLTDKEIRFFSKASEEEVKDYISKEKMRSLRWKQIFFSYFDKVPKKG